MCYQSQSYLVYSAGALKKVRKAEGIGTGFEEVGDVHVLVRTFVIKEVVAAEQPCNRRGKRRAFETFDYETVGPPLAFVHQVFRVIGEKVLKRKQVHLKPGTKGRMPVHMRVGVRMMFFRVCHFGYEIPPFVCP